MMSNYCKKKKQKPPIDNGKNKMRKERKKERVQQ